MKELLAEQSLKSTTENWQTAKNQRWQKLRDSRAQLTEGSRVQSMLSPKVPTRLIESSSSSSSSGSDFQSESNFKIQADFRQKKAPSSHIIDLTRDKQPTIMTHFDLSSELSPSRNLQLPYVKDMCNRVLWYRNKQRQVQNPLPARTIEHTLKRTAHLFKTEGSKVELPAVGY